MKGKKLVIAVILALIVCLVLIPTCAFADGGDTPPAATPDNTETVKPNAETTGEGTYTTLQGAVTAAEELDGTTKITVEDNLTEAVTIDTENTIVINLGGNTLNSKGDYTPAVTVNSGTVTLDNGTINGQIKVLNDATVTLGNNLVLNGQLKVVGTVVNNEAKQPVVDVNCKIETISDAIDIDCDYNERIETGATINIGDGAEVISKDNAAISLWNGKLNELNIKGDCRIEGYVGIAMQDGKLNVSNPNAKVVSTGSNAIHIVYYPESYGHNIKSVDISGGEFHGGIKQESRYGGSVTTANVNITGGLFYGDRPADELIATNAARAEAEMNEKTIYAVGEKSIKALAEDATSGDEVKVTAIPGYENDTYTVPDGSIENVAVGVMITNSTRDNTNTTIVINGETVELDKSYIVSAPTPKPTPDPDPAPTPAPVVVPEQTASEPLSAKYFVVDGKNQQWTAGDLEFKLDSKDVVKVLIDGVEVEFTVAEDGTVTIASAVIEALESGTHEIEFVYADGSCKTAFTVE